MSSRKETDPVVRSLMQDSVTTFVATERPRISHLHLGKQSCVSGA